MCAAGAATAAFGAGPGSGYAESSHHNDKPNFIMQPIIPGLSAPPLTSLTLTGTAPDLRAWQVGQLLQARVLTDTVNNQVTLRIGQTTLTAQTQTKLSAGQTLTVQVARLGDQPLLKVLPQAPPVLADPLAAALRSALPRQTGLAPLLANLGLLAQSARAGTAPPLPATVLLAAAQIYRDLSDSHQAATARGLQQAIRDTGLFLESKLAQLAYGGKAELGIDFKAALLRLQALLSSTPRPAPAAPGAAPGQSTAPPPRPAEAAQPTPPLRGLPVQAQATTPPSLARVALAGNALQELQQQTEGSLARLQLHQLASVPDSTAAQPSWLLELPLRHQAQVDLFHLRIGREAPAPTDSDGAERPWVVSLAFDLPGLGPVQARVAIQGEQVSTTFWAEQAGTTQAFHDHLDTLRQNLQQAGLGIGDLLCRTGQAPHAPTGPHAPLMDTRA